jgi:hypothetical protein
MPEAPNVEVCELWPHHDPTFDDRHYIAWYGKCAECGSKVIVTNRVHKQIKTDPSSVKLVCVQCADRPMISI